MAAASFAQGMKPAARGKIMDAIRDKYNSLGKLTEAKRAEQIIAFMKTFKEITSARRTKDGNLSCMFSDKMSYTIMVSISPTEEEVVPKSGEEFVAAFNPTSQTLESILQSMHADVDIEATASSNSADDLPSGTNARVMNCLGPIYGDPPIIAARLLKSKGYTVAPGLDGSLDNFFLRDRPDVLWISCHSGLGEFTNPATGKNEEMFGILTGEEWSEAKEQTYRQRGWFTMGYVGLAEGLYDRRVLGFFPVNKRYFSVSQEFIKDQWKFPDNAAVFIHGCNSQSLSSTITSAPVDASMFCGQYNLSTKKGAMNMVFALDRMLGANDDHVPPAEAGWPQRPFPYTQIEPDMVKKRLHPFTFRGDNGPITTKTVFFPGPGDCGLLAPSIKNLTPIAYTKKMELNGIFGTDPGDGNRSVKLNNVALVIEKWDKDKITVFLDGGSPEGGEVKVFSRGRESNSRWLSNWKGTIDLVATGGGSLKLIAQFKPNFLGDPWPYRETAGALPSIPFVWTLLSSIGSTCSWSMQGEELDSEGKVIRKWDGGGTPNPASNEGQLFKRDTFGVGGLGDSFQKIVNINMAIVDKFNLIERGSSNPADVKLGDWSQGQSLFQVKYDMDYNMAGDSKVIDDDPSKLSYGAKNATLKWTAMAIKSKMPNNAAR